MKVHDERKGVKGREEWERRRRGRTEEEFVKRVKSRKRREEGEV